MRVSILLFMQIVATTFWGSPLFAGSERQHVFNVPQQSLGSAVIEWARQAGDKNFDPEPGLLVDEEQLSVPVKGQMTAEEALSDILSRSSLQYSVSRSGEFLLQKREIHFDDQLYDFELPPQPLKDTLKLWSRQAGKKNIIFESELVPDDGLTSVLIFSRMSSEQALKELLSRSALEYVITDFNTVTIRKRIEHASQTGGRPVFIKKPKVPHILVEQESPASLWPKPQNKVSQTINTGHVMAVPRLRSSYTVGLLDEEEIPNFAPTNTADIFRNLPGVRAESSGGAGGNSQLNTRGLPVAGGGAKFLIVQEDGLPVLQFGDIAFATADSFIRYDYSVDKIESVLGGSAATLASNSPGAIINVISKTGIEAGGSIGLTAGVDYDHLRTDFEYGGPIGGGWRAHVGGFYREGEGPKNAGYTANSGGQIKANITWDFGNGYTRFYLKRLSDKTITYLPMPIAADGGSLPGFNSTEDTPHSIFLTSDRGLGRGNERIETDLRDGIRPQLTRAGWEFSLEPGGDWSILNRFASGRLDGGWVAPFTAAVGSAQSIADATAALVPGADLSGPASLVYANGPNMGEVFNVSGDANGNGLAMQTNLFNVTLNNMDSYANDLRVSKAFDNMAFTLGFYIASQNIAQTWHWNSYLLEVRGDNAAALDLVDASGLRLSQNGLYAYGVPNFGNCCQRDYDVKYKIRAPYFDFSVDLDNVNLDFSARLDTGTARGYYARPVQAPVDVDQDGILTPNEISVSVIDTANRSPVDYDWRYTSYSAGANFLLNSNSAMFTRISHGARANADRLLFGVVQSDGSIRDNDTVDQVDQFEVGYKRQGDRYGLFATLFYTETEEQNFEISTQRFLNRDYEAIGIEFEGLAQWDRFSLNGTVTYVDAEIASDTISPENQGNTPRRQPDFLYTITPAYEAGPFYAGINIIGATEAFAQDSNILKFDGYTQVNSFVYYRISDQLTLSLNVNNMFDVIAVSEAEEAQVTPIVSPGTAADGLEVIRARTHSGRSSTVTLRYRF